MKNSEFGVLTVTVDFVINRKLILGYPVITHELGILI